MTDADACGGGGGGEGDGVRGESRGLGGRCTYSRDGSLVTVGWARVLERWAEDGWRSGPGELGLPA